MQIILEGNGILNILNDKTRQDITQHYTKLLNSVAKEAMSFMISSSFTFYWKNILYNVNILPGCARSGKCTLTVTIAD